MPAPGVDFLQRIASDRLRRIEEMKLTAPAWKRRERLGSIRAAGRLERALRRGGTAAPLRLLCEIKRASPSKGLLRDSLDPVAKVRAAVATPILVKDFVVDSYQLVDAAARGADGVLLLAALLSNVQMQRLITEARLLGLDCLVEIHEEDELQNALRAGATLIGINNRDLRTFTVHPTTTLQLLPGVPPMVTVVAESGISKPDEIERLRGTRCDAVLMGEVFMVAEDPAGTLAELVRAARGAR
jgi:indole-3-glycerol phosphate synthase